MPTDVYILYTVCEKLAPSSQYNCHESYSLVGHITCG